MFDSDLYLDLGLGIWLRITEEVLVASVNNTGFRNTVPNSNGLGGVSLCVRSDSSSVIGRLIEEGKLTCYLDMYSTRRTFVSLQINKGVPVTTVAKWVGDNPETILKHYARPDDEAVPY